MGSWGRAVGQGRVGSGVAWSVGRAALDCYNKNFAMKRVFLVRHAESEQNVATRALDAGDVSAIYLQSLPRRGVQSLTRVLLLLQLRKLWTIARLGFDAPLSQHGERQ